MIKGSTADALQFLQAWAEKGPWVLTSIIPDGGKTNTQTFTASQLGEMRDWSEERQGKQNVYFTVNPVMRPLQSKAKKTDIRGMVSIHVDVDPRPGEPLESERERALKLLREFKPKPTVIIDSGGGFQGFWVLDQEHRTDGSEERAAELEADYLACLAAHFRHWGAAGAMGERAAEFEAAALLGVLLRAEGFWLEGRGRPQLPVLLHEALVLLWPALYPHQKRNR